MVRQTEAPREDKTVGCYLGGISWGAMNATWPLMRMTLTREGIVIESSSKVMRPLLGLFGLDVLAFEWVEIDEIKRRRSPVPPWLRTNAVSFAIGRRRLTWWSPSEKSTAEILGAIGSIAPEKVECG
jgi:hypothetical protein